MTSQKNGCLRGRSLLSQFDRNFRRDPVAPKLEFEATVHPAKPLQRPKPPARPLGTQSATEAPSTAATSNSGFGTKSAFTASSVPSPDSTTLSPPVTLNYSGGSPVLLVNDNGTNKGVEALINNSKNPGSALFGQTNGLGAGVTGNNTGTNGPAGKFGITNTSSTEPSVLATNDGKGYALLGIQSGGGHAAIAGQNTNSDSSGGGVEGLGGEYGVEGFGAYAGVYGNSQSVGLFGYSLHGTGASGQSDDGFGLYGSSISGDGAYIASSSGTGLYAYSQTNTAIDAETDSSTTGTAAVYANNLGTGAAVIAHSGSGYGITSRSETGNGIMGQSTNNNGVIGEDFGTGNGVYGYSNKGFAGYFAGKVGATSYVTLSDKNDKTNIRQIESKSILSKVSALQVSEWVFKSDPTKNHVGPMAQDFHAAFRSRRR